MARENRAAQGMKKARLSIMALVTSNDRNPNLYCITNWMPNRAVAMTNSQRERLIDGLLTARRGSNSNFIANSVISTMARNCISFILGCKITKIP